MAKFVGYSMEAVIEAARLEQQVLQSNYSISEEMNDFTFTPEEVVMDAGCGTGVLARYLVRHKGVSRVDGLDFSDLRVRQAEDLCQKEGLAGIRFFREDLSQISTQFHQRYDATLCRYVIEHTHDPLQVIQELKKTLKPGGRLVIFELDGVVLNLHSENPIFQSYMKELTPLLQFDLHVGRKVPSLLKKAGLSKIQWSAKLLSCQGTRLEEEYENTEKRFIAITPFLTQALRSPERCEEFKKVYLEEMRKEENTLVFTKFICSGINL